MLEKFTAIHWVQLTHCAAHTLCSSHTVLFTHCTAHTLCSLNSLCTVPILWVQLTHTRTVQLTLLFSHCPAHTLCSSHTLHCAHSLGAAQPCRISIPEMLQMFTAMSQPCRISIPKLLEKLTAMQDKLSYRCLKSSQPCTIGCPRDA